PSRLNVSEDLAVGDLGPGSMLIEGRAEVRSKSGSVGSLSSTPSRVSIEGPLAQGKIDGDLKVGNTDSQEVVRLWGGTIASRSVDVKTNGLIVGVGLLAVAPMNRFTNGGFISPGLSPGVLTINGSYEQRPEGRLLIEIGGTNFVDYDHLVVTNAATLGG